MATDDQPVNRPLPVGHTLFETTFMAMDQGFCLLEKVDILPDQPTDFRYLLVNPAFEKHTGLQQVVGKTIRQVVSQVEESTMAVYEQIALTGEPSQFQAYIALLDSWIEANAFRISHHPAQLAVVFTNITDRKRAEQHQAFLSDISKQLVGLTSIADTMEQLGEKIGGYFGVRWCMFSELVHDNELAVVSYGWSTEDVVSLKGTYRMRDFLTDEQLARHNAGQFTIVDDVQTDGRVSAETYGALGIRSFIIVPIARQQQWTFLLSIIDDKPRPWRPDEIDLIGELTDRIWTRLERAHAEEALRQSEERHRSLFETIRQGFSLAEVVRDTAGNAVDWRLLEMNPVFEDYAGMSVAECVGRTAADVFGSVDPHWLAVYDRVVRNHKAEHSEAWFGPIKRWVGVDVYPGRGDQFTILYDDITERKQTEAALEAERTRLHEIFMQAPAIIGLLTGPNHVFELANPLYMQLVGKVGKARDILGMTVREALPEVTDQGFFELLDTVYKTGEPFIGNEMPVKVARNGHQKPGEVYLNFVYHPYRDAAGTVSGIFVHAVEVTEQVMARQRIQESEQRQTFLLKLSDALRPLVDSVEIANRTAQLVGAHFGVANAHYAQVVSEATEDYLVVPGGYVAPGARSLAGRYRLGDFPGVGADRFADHTLVVDRVADDGRLTEKDRASWLALGIGALLVVPLRKRGHLVAQLSLYNAAPWTWTQGEVQFLEGIAERTRDALERARAEGALARSEEKYRTLFDTMAEGFTQCGVVRDARGRVVDLSYLTLNRALEQQTGLDRKLMIGRHLTDVFPKADVERFMPIYARAANSGEPVSFEEYVQLLDRWYLVSVYLTNQDELSIFYRDITDRKKTEEALRQSEESFRVITKAALAFAWICSAPDGANIYFNDQWYDYTGQTQQQAADYGWTQAVHPEDWARIAPLWQRCQQTGEVYQGEVRYRRHDGAYRWFAFRALPRTDAQQTLQAWYGLSFDIHDAKEAEEALREANQRKDEFLAMLAHELRNPLTPVRTGLQVLSLTGSTDPTLSTLLPIMNRQMDHVMRLVDDLLDVSRISRGNIALRNERLDLREVVDQAVQAMRPLYETAGRQLHLDLPVLALPVRGDATRLHQVVTNLLTNGLRYTRTDRNGEPGQVWLSLERVALDAVIRVRDNGIGLAADQLQAIFALFVQVDTSLARTFGGLGVGLSLVQQLVQLHRGRVEAFSPGLEQGSEFVIHLPLVEA